MSDPGTHVPFMLFSPAFAQRRLKRLRGYSRALVKLLPTLASELENAGIEADTSDFFLAALSSATLLGTLVFLLIAPILVSKKETLLEALIPATGYSLLIGVMVFLVYVRYPSIMGAKKASQIDKNLMFAVKDLVLHTASGSTLYNSIVSVSQSGYGEISAEFAVVAKEIASGKSADEALEFLATRSKSDYLKKVIWQIVNTLRAGGNLKEALESIVESLSLNQKASIMSYANELNLWSLIYMLFAVAAPTIGITMMIILSSFANVGIDEVAVTAFIALTCVVQVIIISLIKSRRPVVEF